MPSENANSSEYDIHHFINAVITAGDAVWWWYTSCIGHVLTYPVNIVGVCYKLVSTFAGTGKFAWREAQVHVFELFILGYLWRWKARISSSGVSTAAFRFAINNYLHSVIAKEVEFMMQWARRALENMEF